MEPSYGKLNHLWLPEGGGWKYDSHTSASTHPGTHPSNGIKFSDQVRVKPDNYGEGIKLRIRRIWLPFERPWGVWGVTMGVSKAALVNEAPFDAWMRHRISGVFDEYERRTWDIFESEKFQQSLPVAIG